MSTDIDEIVLKGLEKEPSGRFQTAGEMARAIDSILYSYKPAPTNADLALYVAAVESPESQPMPSTPVPETEGEPEGPPPGEVAGAPAESTIPAVIPEAEPLEEPAEAGDEGAETIAVGRTVSEIEREPEEEEPAAVFGSSLETEKKSRAVPIAKANILILATAGVGAFMMMRGGEPGGPQTDASAGLGVNPTVPTTDTAPETLTADEPVAAEAAVTPEALEEEQLDEAEPGLGEEDLALIDQAVRDRVEAERQRMERARRETAVSEPVEPVREEVSEPSPPIRSEPSPPPAEQPTPEPAAETPADTTTEPAQPAQAQGEPAVEAPSTEPTTEPAEPEEPEEPQVTRGDLVEPGTPGLVEPEIVSLKSVRYPQLARRNNVEGIVVVRALISEDGEVLETQLLRSIAEDVGLNEAALDMVRGGEFEPATLEGVEVRSWKTIPIPFRIE